MVIAVGRCRERDILAVVPLELKEVQKNNAAEWHHMYGPPPGKRLRNDKKFQPKQCLRAQALVEGGTSVEPDEVISVFENTTKQALPPRPGLAKQN